MKATKTVLVVDDDQGIVELLTMALESQGYDVISATDGAALRLAREHVPALILLDIEMPIMDGVEVSRRVRADPQTARIPIVVMSAHDRLDDKGAGMQANEGLAKPFALDDLYKTVARWAEA